MEKKNFEKLVEEAMCDIPKKSLDKIKNVAIIVEYKPTSELLKKHQVPRGWTLFGVYEGIPLISRGFSYGMGETLPDRIVIFQEPIENEAGRDEEKIKKMVQETVLHEIGHYFGMNERTVREWERVRLKKTKEISS